MKDEVSSVDLEAVSARDDVGFSAFSVHCKCAAVARFPENPGSADET